MAFALHTRVTFLAEFRTGSQSGPTIEYANPGFSIAGAGLSATDEENVQLAMGNWWPLPSADIPANCFYLGGRFASILPSGKQDGPAREYPTAAIGGASSSNRATFMAQVATLESDATAVLRRKRGRIYFPCGNTINDGLYDATTSNNFAESVAAFLGTVNSALDSDHYVCTASRTAGINYRVASVTADNVPDYMSSRKRSLVGTRSPRHLLSA